MQERKRKDTKRLEVFIEAETAGILVFLFGGGFLVLLGAVHDTSLLVVTNTLLEEVGLAGKRNVLHEVKGIGSVVVLLVAESDQKTVSNELDILAHQLGVHSEQSTGKSIGQELLFNGNGVNNDVLNNLGARTVVEVGEEQAGKVGVKTLVTRDEFVGESQTRHQTTLLQPEDRGKRAREEDTLNGSECDKALSKGGLLVRDPAQSPVGLLANAGNYAD